MSQVGAVAELRSRYDHFIGGAFVPPVKGGLFATYNPASGQKLSDVARGTAEDVAVAVNDAQLGFSRWRDMRPSDRGRVLFQLAQELRRRSDFFAQLESLDTGKPLRQARNDVTISARYFEYYAGLADKIQGDTIPIGRRYHSYTRREPFGVIGQIIPWNAPLQQAARGIAPALAAGNSVVAKPAELTPITCLELAAMAIQCGLPSGVLNVVAGYGPEAGTAIVEHPLVLKIAFTGSAEVGKLVMRQAANRIVPLTLELGGKSPNLVFADADLAAAVRGAITAFTTNAGQICSAGTRLLVQQPVHDDFVEKLAAQVQRMRLGPGLNDPDIGPLVSQEQRDRALSYVRLGEQEGARAIVGGCAPTDPHLASGYYVEPAVLTGVDNRMRVAQEEIFGPVLVVIAFDDEDDAVRIANESQYGLVAGVWTQDLSRAHRIAARLDVGQVFVNDYYSGGVETPFGGWKFSGFGSEKGIEAILNYTHVKSVTIRL
jgi:aldehyde dehydrogenase (NAD+)